MMHYLITEAQADGRGRMRLAIHPRHFPPPWVVRRHYFDLARWCQARGCPPALALVVHAVAMYNGVSPDRIWDSPAPHESSHVCVALREYQALGDLPAAVSAGKFETNYITITATAMGGWYSVVDVGA